MWFDHFTYKVFQLVESKIEFITFFIAEPSQ